MALLDITQLNFAYQRGRPVIPDLTLSLDEGQLVGLVGPNGSGKSTLIKLCFDLLEIGSGTITVGGMPHTSAGARQASMYLPSDNELPEFLSGTEYLETLFSLYGESLPDASVVNEWFTEFGMSGRQHDLIEDYSHGMCKKLQIVSALLLKRPLTVIDETLNGIDLDAQRASERHMRELPAGGSSVLLCSHDFSLLESLVSQVWVLNRGRLAATIDVAALTARGERLRPAVEAVLFGEPA